MNRKALSLAIVIPLLCAVIGNALIPQSAMTWYNELKHPWFKLPLWGSIIVALIIYVGYGVIIYRGLTKKLILPVVLAVSVILGNEIWNLFFFGARNISLTFWITCIFAILVLVQALSIRWYDKLSFVISMVYLVWVIGYDLPWLYLLQGMNL